MTDKYKEALQAVLEAKKQKDNKEGAKRANYQSTGEKRTGVKRYKKGGLFDK